MTHQLLFLLISILIFNTKTTAQCPFNPTITPANLILCPNESDTLWTEVYDSYQWYKDGNIIPGATDQFLVVDAFNYGGSMVSVEATLSSCTEMSPQVLVDGWVFLLPVVQSTGNYTFDGSDFLVCVGDTIFFELLQPYDTNVQWTENSSPIAGATANLLFLTSAVVSSTKDYNVCGAPSICPNFIQCLGVNLPVRFISCATGIDENFQNAAVRINPNPFSSQTILQSDKAFENASLTLYNAHGQVVKQMSNLVGETIILERNNLPAGLYFVQMSQDGKVVLTDKLVITDN